MALLLRSPRVLQRVATASYSGHAPAYKPPSPIGNREVVGFGCNGKEMYSDREDFPMPAIRFKAPGPEIQVII